MVILLQAPDVIEKKSPSKEWPENGEIVFKEYATRYRPGLDLVLKGISCSFGKGEKV